MNRREHMGRQGKAEPLLIMWKQCVECGHRIAANGRAYCPNCELPMTPQAVAGAIVDDRREVDQP